MYFSFSNKKEKGQGLVEYALILVLVAIIVITVLALLGPIIGNVFSTINNTLSGFGSGVITTGEVSGDVTEYNQNNYATLPSAVDGFCAARSGQTWYANPGPPQYVSSTNTAGSFDTGTCP